MYEGTSLPPSQLNKGPETADWSITTSDHNKFVTDLTLSEAQVTRVYDQKKIRDGRLLITVLDQNLGTAPVEYSIELAQHERMLFEGETDIGKLFGYESVTYELYVNEHAYLEVQSLGKDCFDASVQEEYSK